MEVSTKTNLRWKANETNFNNVIDPHKRITLYKGVQKTNYKTEKKYMLELVSIVHQEMKYLQGK